jgi:indole-3-glycerol phosphate synthase
MSVLIEVHDKAELERALLLKSPLLGVNNRNLKTLDVSLDTAIELAALIPQDKIKIAESGIFSHADIVRLNAVGYEAFLVGESLMRQPDVAAATKELLGL